MPVLLPSTASKPRFFWLAKATHRLLAGSLWLGLLLSPACSNDHDPAPVDQETLRQRAMQFYEALYNPTQPGLDDYLAAGYTEHQVGAGFTLTGLKDYARARAQARGTLPLVIHRTLADGQLVALHVEEQVAADSSVAHLALFHFNASGKIEAHWEAVQGQPRHRANPNTMFDGAAVNYQSTAGRRNLAVVVAADQRAFNQYDTLVVRQTRAVPYIQHNPTAGNGADALIGLLTFLKTNNFHTTLTSYQQLAEGDFVLELSNYQTTPAFPNFTNTIAFDLTRVDESGKDAEHWDVLEELNGADKSKAF